MSLIDGLSDDPTRIEYWLARCIDLQGSDLHIGSAEPVYIRIHGELRQMSKHLMLEEAIIDWLNVVITAQQFEELQRDRSLDFSFGYSEGFSFRVNAYFQRKKITIAIRKIAQSVMDLDALGLPDAVKSLCLHKQGLVLVTGPTGSGKSTTLAALIEIINRFHRKHIITVEDPIEFNFINQNSLIHQREVPKDVPNFNLGLRAAMREDPDIIMVGEMRDVETVQTALYAAETGHLVFSTLHTNSGPSTIERIGSFFPGDQQNALRKQLSLVLKGVVSQRLVKAKDDARLPVIELLFNSHAVANMIASGNIKQIFSMMEIGGGEGMITREKSLAEWVKIGRLDLRSAMAIADRPEQLERILGYS